MIEQYIPMISSQGFVCYAAITQGIEEVDVPAFALYTLLSGGPLNPRQLEKIMKERR